MGKDIFSYEEKEQIKQLYLNGISTVKIGKQFNVYHKKIAEVLEEFNIPRTGVGKRKYKINEHYFDTIDTPNKAYFLGFLYADGSNFCEKQTISLSLEESDKHILESFRKELEYDKPLNYIDYSNKHDFGYTYKNQYQLIIFSRYMCDVLNSAGVYPCKSLILTFPKFLSDSLLQHFIRGYFDGDGSYCPHITKDGKFQPLITFTSTESFCVDLQKYLQKKLQIPCGNIYDASCHNGITKVLSFSGCKQTKTFLDWLYKDAELFLYRKYEKYINSFYMNNSLSA